MPWGTSLYFDTMFWGVHVHAYRKALQRKAPTLVLAVASLHSFQRLSRVKLDHWEACCLSLKGMTAYAPPLVACWQGVFRFIPKTFPKTFRDSAKSGRNPLRLVLWPWAKIPVSPSEHPTKMGGEVTYQPKWDPIGFDHHSQYKYYPPSLQSWKLTKKSFGRLFSCWGTPKCALP